MATNTSHKLNWLFKVSIKGNEVIIFANLPIKWGIVIILVLIAWQAPEFWKIVQMVLSVIKP